MRETAVELAALQEMIDRILARTRPHMRAIFHDHYGSSAFDWSADGVYVRLDADRFYTYSRTPDAFAA